MKCPKCGFDNPDIASYCINCGARVDGKILCPKCGKPISPDEVECPHCGKKIPHETNEKENNKEISQHTKNIFSKIFLVVTLVLLFVGIVLPFGQYVSFTGSSELDYGFSWFYLFKQWGLITDAINASLSGGEVAIAYLKVLIPFVIVVLNIGICLVFGLIGINNTFKELKVKDNIICTSYKYVAVQLCSNILGTQLILSMNNNVGGIYSISSYQSLYIWTAFVSLLAIFIITIITSKDRRRPVLLLERIFFGCAFFFGLILISNIGEVSLISKNNSFRLYSLVEKSIIQISSIVDSQDITGLIISSSLYLFVYVNGLIVSSLIIFISIGFFSKNERGMMFKIPSYVLGFIILLVSTISMILNIVICIMMNINNGDTIYYIGSSAIVQFITANLLFGSLVTCLSLTKGYRNYQRIVSITNKK